LLKQAKTEERKKEQGRKSKKVSSALLSSSRKSKKEESSKANTAVLNEIFRASKSYSRDLLILRFSGCGARQPPSRASRLLCCRRAAPTYVGGSKAAEQADSRSFNHETLAGLLKMMSKSRGISIIFLVYINISYNF
jgi:hypothetical protein